jgi:altronate dehydratase large subunit
MTFYGYRRWNGRVGVRNHLLILSTVVCANEVAQRIHQRVPTSVLAVHPFGCGLLGEDLEQMKRTLIGFSTNPNVGAVLVVGLGCEELDARCLAEDIMKSGQRVESLVIQECGGSRKTTRNGIEVAREMARDLKENERVRASPRELIVATECGGSDFSSGLTANPAIGYASDWLVNEGGTVILSETTEIIGAEHLLAKRAIHARVSMRITDIVRKVEEDAKRRGVDIRGAQPSPGNIRGGLTTIEEKSLGCIYKAGTSPIEGVVKYAESIPATGLWIMDTPGQDVESVTGMVAGGAQIVLFSTGLGTPVGCPVAPVIKITGNPDTAQTMGEHIDVNASRILTGRDTIEGVGKKTVEFLLAVADGKRTKAEKLGHHEFAINRIGKTI